MKTCWKKLESCLPPPYYFYRLCGNTVVWSIGLIQFVSGWEICAPHFFFSCLSSWFALGEPDKSTRMGRRK